MRTSRRLAIVIALVATISVTFPALTAATHSWGGYHWARTSNPFTLKLGDNLTTAWGPYLVTTSSDWTASSVLDTTIVAGLTRPKNCRPTAGRVEVCNASYGNNGWLGLAQIWISGGTHISQGTAKVNDYYFNMSAYNTPAWRYMVMCQEVAHAFGLGHQDETQNNANLGSCMDYTNDPDGGAGGASSNDPSNEHPNAHDFAQLESIYNSHLDSTTTVSSPAQSAGAASGWGRLVAVTNGGGTSVYVAGVGDQLVISFVIWAT